MTYYVSSGTLNPTHSLTHYGLTAKSSSPNSHIKCEHNVFITAGLSSVCVVYLMKKLMA